MKRYLLLLFAFVVVIASCTRQSQTGIKRPKLVIGIVIDQMRWDYLYRYYNRYGNDGFKRLMNNGYKCENTNVSYMPAYTAPGHTCIYTGSVPSIHGMAGNNWIDNATGRNWYCVDDTTVYQVGDASKMPSMSPRNMHVSTITDELQLATNFHARTFGIAIKDRGAILPAGHAANGAYWYDDRTGKFVTSTYYKQQYQNPTWLQNFNKREVADSLAKQNWSLLYDANTYTQSTKDETEYEDAFKGENLPVFPHKVSGLAKQDRVAAIKTMPAGNTLTLDMVRACMDGEQLGKHDETDFMCVSLSSTDYAGHQFGPNAVEMEDMYLRLDQEIAGFLSYLDKTVGKGNYLLFLTADHGAAHNPKFLIDNNIPAGIAMNISADLNNYLKTEFKTDSPLIRGVMNYQVFLNDDNIAANKNLHRDEIKASIRNWILNFMTKTYKIDVSYVLDMENLNSTPVPEPIRTMAINGYNRERSGCLQIVLNPGWFESDRFTGTTHGSWNPYDTHIPLIWYGWQIPHGETNRPIGMVDIAPTLAALLHIQTPNGNIGKPILEITK